MKKPIVPFVLTVVVALIWCGAGPTATAAASLVVSVNKTVCPNAQYTRIQDAVNAASAGDTIQVCAGTYVEQVSIGKALTIDADNGAVLMPAAMQANAASLFDGSPLATAVLVENTSDVTISGLTVDGANNGISECAPDLIGISYLNASGTLRHLAVRNFKLANSLIWLPERDGHLCGEWRRWSVRRGDQPLYDSRFSEERNHRGRKRDHGDHSQKCGNGRRPDERSGAEWDTDWIQRGRIDY